MNKNKTWKNKNAIKNKIENPSLSLERKLKFKNKSQ